MSIKEYYAEKLEKINIRKMTHPVVIKENIRPHLTIPIYKIILNMSKKIGIIRTPNYSATNSSAKLCCVQVKTPSVALLLISHINTSFDSATVLQANIKSSITHRWHTISWHGRHSHSSHTWLKTTHTHTSSHTRDWRCW